MKSKSNQLPSPNIVTTAVRGICSFASDAIKLRLEPSRIARGGYAVLSCGCSLEGSFPGIKMGSHLTSCQQTDGGWSDVEETIWCLGYISQFNKEFETELEKGKTWLGLVQLPCGAWGKTERDQPRIPITALASVLVPSVVDTAALEWLAKQWEADFASPTQLTYKGAFFLLSQAYDKAPAMDDLVDRTIVYLCKEQNEDGGFGPWKEHPVGSDPWTTGVVLWGLSKFPQRVPRDILTRAVKWLQTNQLSNGLWPYHYLDDGSSMALIGLSSVLPVLIES